MLVRWGSVTLVELIASEDAGISRNPKHKVLVSSQGGERWGGMAEPCGHQGEAPPWAEKAASARAMRWECARHGQGVPRAAVCPNGGGKGQATSGPRRDLGFVPSRVEAPGGF